MLWAETDGEGRFAWEDLEGGPWTLVATDEAFSFPPIVLRDVRNSIEPIDLRVPDPGVAGTLAVEIVDANGAAVFGASLYVRDLGNAHGEVFSPPPKQSRLEVTAPRGNYALEVRADGYVRVSLGEHSLEAGERIDLGRIVLDQGSSFALEIGAPDSEVPGRLVLELRDALGKLAWSTAWGSSYAGEPLRVCGWARPGRYLVTADRLGRTATGVIETPREGEAELRLDLGPR